jgi:hypothetical protein
MILSISPAAHYVVDKVGQMSQRRPVPSTTVAGLLGWSDRTVRHYLSMAERARIVERLEGPKSGWAIKTVPRVVTIEGQLRLPGFSENKMAEELVYDMPSKQMILDRLADDVLDVFAASRDELVQEVVERFAEQIAGQSLRPGEVFNAWTKAAVDVIDEPFGSAESHRKIQLTSAVYSRLMQRLFTDYPAFAEAVAGITSLGVYLDDQHEQSG